VARFTTTPVIKPGVAVAAARDASATVFAKKATHTVRREGIFMGVVSLGAGWGEGADPVIGWGPAAGRRGREEDASEKSTDAQLRRSR